MGLVDYETSAGVATVQLNDPPFNGYTFEMMKDLDAAILEARFDPDVQVIVITGHGDRFFCAGANVNMLKEADPTFKYYFCLHANETLLRLEHTPKLVIAAINGHCVGGGLEVALACDIRVARKGSGKIGLPEVSLGVLPGTGGTQRLARLLGPAKALQFMIEGTTVSVDEGVERGLVHELWECASNADFMAKTMEYARRFTRPGKASLAVGAIKRAVVSGVEMGLEQGLALERELQAQLFVSADAKEGLAAYVDKRKAVFSGK